MAVWGSVSEVGKKSMLFFRELHRDWKITALRTSIDRLLYQMVLPYLSIYTLALGATHTQLGMVNCIGMAAAGLISPFNGWIIDRIGIKAVYMTGHSVSGLVLSGLLAGAKLARDHFRPDRLLDRFYDQPPRLCGHMRQHTEAASAGDGHERL